MRLLRAVDFALGNRQLFRTWSTWKCVLTTMRMSIGVQTPFLQGIDQAVGLVRHARIDNDVMMAMRKQRASGAPPTAGKQHIHFP